MSEYLKRVTEIENDQQQRTALHSTGSQVVIAGPGSGKTYLLTTKLAQTLLDGNVRYPQKVACITFSKQLAADLKNELAALGVYDSDRVYVDTVHAFSIAEIIMPVACLFLQQQLPTPLRIASTQEKYDVLQRALVLQGQNPPRSKEDLSNVSSNIDKFRRLHYCPTTGGFDSAAFSEADGFSRTSLKNLDWSRLAQDYSSKLLELDLASVDFVQIEMFALQVVLRYRSVGLTLTAAYPWWFIDEYQDLSPLFHRLVTHIIESKQITAFAIGDPNQCIFEELQGSKPRFLEELSETVRHIVGSELITLKTNYRSAQNIIDLGDVVLGKNTGYKSSRARPGICHAVESRSFPLVSLVRRTLQRLIDDPENPQAKHIAILAPRRGTLKQLLHHLENDSVWSVAIDKDPDYFAYHDLTMWIRELAGWCAGRDRNFFELVPFWYQLNRHAYGVIDEQRCHELDNRLFDSLWSHRGGDRLLYDWLRSLVKELEFSSLLRHYEEIRPDDVQELRDLYSATGKSERLRKQTIRQFSRQDSQVLMTTFHGSKGLEFDAAIIVQLDEIRRSNITPELRSRLAYVAVTRARTDLYILIDKPNLPFAAELAKQPRSVLGYWYCAKNGTPTFSPSTGG